jgi:tetratricopeptide (TPR) repeat protein
LRGIAEAYEGLGKLDQAIATYCETIQKFPDSPQTPWAHIGIARSLIGLGRYDEARAELREVAQKSPGTTAAAWAEEQTGYAYLDQQKPRQALDYIKRALHDYPPETHPREMGFPSLKYLRIEIALPHLNDAYVQLGDDAAALEEFGKLRAAPDVGPTALYYTAVHHQRLGHYDQAIDLFTQYLALPDQFFRLPDAHFNRAMSYFTKGDYDRAIAGWREVATKFPLHYLAQESAPWIRIAEQRQASK